MKFKTIFFDIYQTLVSVDFEGNEDAWDIFSEFFNKRDVNIDSAKFRDMLSQEKLKYYQSVNDPGMRNRHHNLFNLVNDVFLNYGIQAKKNELFDLIWEFRRSHHPDFRLYPGIKEMLQKMSLRYDLVVASYTQGSYTHKELEELGIAQYFSHFIFSSDIGYRKTGQEFYKICLQKTGNVPEECLVVGDNYLQDVVIPKKVGLKAVLIKNPSADRQNLIDDVKPDGIVKLEDIATLPLVIQSIE